MAPDLDPHRSPSSPDGPPVEDTAASSSRPPRRGNGLSTDADRVEERFRLALKAGDVAVFRQDRALRYTWICNPVPGFEIDDMIGKRDEDVMGEPEEVRATTKAKRAVMESGVTQRHEFPITTNGSTRYFEYTIAPWRNDDGDVVGVTCAAVDVTEHRKREEALRQAREDAEAARHEAERAKEEAEAAREEAEEANRLKSIFLANASHALLTPLSGMLSLVDALRARKIEGTREILARIRRSGEHLRETIDGLLDLSKIQSGGAGINVQPINVAEVVFESAELFRGQAEEKGLTFVVNVPSAPVELDADPSALRRIVSNLVSNAIKYTASGRVSVGLVDAPDAAVLTVEDTGAGIDGDFLPQLFEPFTRASGRGLTDEGTGLGMAIAKRLVDALGGTIEVDTEVDAGTTLTVRLPK